MARVRFEPAGVEVEAEPGTEIIDLCDSTPSAEVPFSCRSANCGTCRVEVREGMGDLLPPEDEELDVLDVFGDDPKRHRLCCQIKLAPHAARVVLRVIEPL